jgi:hypothetical protein
MEYGRSGFLFVVLLAVFLPAGAEGALSLAPIATYDAMGEFDEGAAETVAFDPATQRLFISNGEDTTVDVLDISDPANPTALPPIDVSPFGDAPTHVETMNGIVAVTMEADPSQDPGVLALFTTDGDPLGTATVGALPDSCKFTPDGTKVVVVNEGEPSDDYLIDPEGSISIVDLASLHVETASFAKYNPQKSWLRMRGIRIFGPAANEEGELVPGAATVAQDLEPENLTISEDSSTAYVTIQENNALAIVDIDDAEVDRLVPLGYKAHFLPGRGLDASDKDKAINIAQWPVFGMYQPDGIAAVTVNGNTYLLMANEGDAREYIYEIEVEDPETGEIVEEEVEALVEESRADDLMLTGGFLGHWGDDLLDRENLGRLNVTTIPPAGKIVTAEGDELFKLLFSYGARSFTVLNENGVKIWDSGDDIEQRIAASEFSDFFNATDDENDTFDNRSDNKGPEPEDVAVGKVGDRLYAFVVLERIGGVMVYDITKPWRPAFVTYANNRDFSVIPPDPPDEKPPEYGGTQEEWDEEKDDEWPEIWWVDQGNWKLAGDLSPEGIVFIAAEDSPTGMPLVVLANEVSGTTTVYGITAN